MGYVHPAADVRAAGHAASERLERWIVDLPFDSAVAAAVTAFAATDEAAALTGERARLLAFTRRDLRLAGHELDEDARAELRAAMARLVEIGVRFNQNIAEVDDVLLVTDDELDGMPEDYRDGLGRTDDGRYRVTMAYPDVIPFMEHARRRDRREQLSWLFNNRAVESNRALLAEAVGLRERVAELFGEPSWAHHTMGEKMAGDPKEVDAFYAELVPPLTRQGAGRDRPHGGPAGRRDGRLRRAAALGLAVLRHRAAASPSTASTCTRSPPTSRWNRCSTGCWRSRPRRSACATSGSTTSPSGTTTCAASPSSTWRRTSTIAVVHMDLHPREGKFSHAAAFDLVPGRRQPDGSYRTPVACIVANVTKPAADRPSLLTHEEVLTLFHEFGHILHQTLTRAETARFSGTNTELDFVEAPSQIMEHWCWRPEVLARFARHHRTGEVIPDRLVHQLVAARDLNVGVGKLRQIQFGVLDMGFHGPRREDEVSADGGRDLDAILLRAEAVSGFPHQAGTFFPASFGHLLSGYDAGYYGYLWSEVFGDDMFSRFAAEGVTNPTVGGEYRRQILERGGSVDATEMLERFLGRRPEQRRLPRQARHHLVRS